MSNDPLVEPTAWELQQRIFDDAWPYWREKFEATDELHRFLLGDRYVDDNGQFNRDRRGVQIRGQEIEDTIAHVVAKATEKARSVEGRPIDSDSDPELAEAKVALITNKLADPYVGFDRELYKGTMACQQGRRAVVWMDWVPSCGPYGKVIWSNQPNGSVMWDAAYHPHHPLCQWVIRHRRPDYRQANRDFGVTWLRPDHEALLPRTGSWRPGIPLMAGFSDRVAQQSIKDSRTTIREVWLKNDPTIDPAKASTNENRLDPGQRYMSCASNCGYRSQTQGALKAQGKIKRGLPESVPAATGPEDMSGCPTCGGELTRIDAVDKTQFPLMYPKGRRLICVAPFCPNPDGQEPLWDDGWPIPTARSFPALFLFASVNPGDETGGRCLVDKMWDPQVASDNLQTILIQRVFEHRDYWRMPTVGFYNVRGARFEFRDDDENLILQDMTKTRNYGPSPLEHIAGTGADPEGIPVWNMINNSLVRYRPQADIEPIYGQANDANVGTVQAQIQQAETTTADFVRRRNDELSMAYGVYDDYLSATMTPDELHRLNIDGVDVLIRAWGTSLPNYDYVVSETPEFTGISAEKSKAWDAAMQTGIQLGPEALDAWAQFHNVPTTVVRSIKKLFADKQAAQQQMTGEPGPQGQGQPAGMTPGGPGPGLPMGAINGQG
jgi:hypothetical protein